MFPDLTRWQAEADQRKVSNGQDSWKLDAVKTAQHFAEQLLRTGGTATLVSGGGRNDLDALVNLAFPSPGGGGPARITKVTLSRLEGNASGIWEVTAVDADWMYISSPQQGLNTHISSPVTVTGFGPQFEAQIGVVWVLDHLSNKIGQAFAMAPSGSSPPTTFTATFSYTSSFRAGAQEPAAPANQPRGVECAAGDQQLHALSAAQVRPDHDMLGRAVGVQHEDLERVAASHMLVGYFFKFPISNTEIDLLYGIPPHIVVRRLGFEGHKHHRVLYQQVMGDTRRCRCARKAAHADV